MRPVFLCCDFNKIKQINELEPGDVVIWPAGERKAKKTVLRMFPTPSERQYTIVLEDTETGKWMIQKLAAERIIGLA